MFAGMISVNPISEFSLLTMNPKMLLIKAADDSFGPVTSVGNEPWVGNFSHTKWYEMSEYYITAFKTGSYPAITVRISL